MPRWVKVFAAVGLIAAAILGAMHLTDGGGGHFTHGDIGDHAAPAERGSHLP